MLYKIINITTLDNRPRSFLQSLQALLNLSYLPQLVLVVYFSNYRYLQANHQSEIKIL